VKTPVTYILSRAAMLAILVFFSGTVSATTLYTSFSGGSGFNHVDSWQTDIEQETAAKFSPSVTATLDQIRIAVDWFQGPNTFRIILTTNVGGVPSTNPANELERWDTTPSINPFPSSPGIVTLTSIHHPTLTAGQTYWIIVDAGDETVESETQSHGHWFLTTTSAEGIARRERDEADQPWGAWNGMPTDGQTAFDVTGTVGGQSGVPEPSTVGMGLLGLAAIVVGRRRTRRN
jgi:MYXO-CTERM domain-containing protein